MNNTAEQKHEEQIEGIKSLVLNYAQPMKATEAFPYQYDYNRHLNVYSDANGTFPVVDCPEDILCILTKTEAVRESDDTANMCLAIATKTFSEKEADD